MIRQDGLERARREIPEQLRESDPVCASLLAEAWWGTTESCIELRVPSQFAREKLEQRGAIRQLIQDRFPGFTVSIVHDPEVATIPQVGQLSLEMTNHPAGEVISPAPAPEPFIFDNFVVSDTNRVAHALAMAVAQGIWHKPVLLVGGTGCGKTHLLKAAVQLAKKTGLSVERDTAERFSNSYGAALQGDRDSKMPRFRSKYRDTGLLVLDEVQFFSGKEGFTGEFLQTFKDREDRQAPILLSSSVPLDKLKFPEELRRRLEAAHCPIHPHDEAIRAKIVLQMAARLGLELREEWATLAAKRTESVGELQNGVDHAHLCATRLGRTLDYYLIEEVFPEKDVDISMASAQDVIRAAANHFGIAEMDIKKGGGRKDYATVPRHLAMFIMRENLHLSYAVIGKALGDLDHSTVIHACARIRELLEDPRKGPAKAAGRGRKYQGDAREDIRQIVQAVRKA